jgi:hypothetical protein
MGAKTVQEAPLIFCEPNGRADLTIDGFGMQATGSRKYMRLVEGEIMEEKVAKVPAGIDRGRCKFVVGDACDMPALKLGKFDAGTRCPRPRAPVTRDAREEPALKLLCNIREGACARCPGRMLTDQTLDVCLQFLRPTSCAGCPIPPSSWPI